MGFHAGIVRILGADGITTVGTGFVASQSIIVTCAHVVVAAWGKGGGENEPVRIRFYSMVNPDDAEQLAHVDKECWSPPAEQDIAILRLDTPLPAGVEPLVLGSSPKLHGHGFISFGFPDVGKYDELPVEGDISGRIRVHEGPEVLALDCRNITQGMSGAPVRDEETKLVVGMINHFPAWSDKERRDRRQTAGDKFGRMEGVTFASTSEAIRDLCPDLQLSDREPYLGLRTFAEKDADLFFGRDVFVETLISKLRSGAQFIAVVGPSGSGKSSAVFAGLFPKLREGAFAGSREWQLVSFRPGSDPYEALAAEGIVTDEETNLAEAVTDYLEQNPDVTHLVLFADQFEEVFARCPEPIRTQFLNEWSELVEKMPGVSLILTMQAGYYYGIALEHQKLGALIEKGQETILRMSGSELEKAVSDPAEEVVGLKFESGLVADIVAEAAEVKHPLPLVQESLLLLWKEEKANGSLPMLTHETYRNKVRGIAGAIERRATEVYTSLPGDEQETARHVFTRLVHYGEGEEGHSLQKLTLAELVTQSQSFEVVQRVTKKLADERLLVTGEESDAEMQTVEIIHKILIEEWPELKAWITDQEGFLRWLQKLSARLNEWKSEGCDDDLLLRGPLLADAEDWLEKKKDNLSEEQLAFIAKSMSAHKRGERWRKAALAMALTAAVIMALLAWLSFDRGVQAEESANESLSMLLAGNANEMAADDYVLALLLAVQANRFAETSRARAVLLSLVNTSNFLATVDKVRVAYARNLGNALSPALIDEMGVDLSRNTLITGGIQVPLRIWDLDSLELLGDLPLEVPMFGCLALSPDQSILAVCNGTAAEVYLWDMDQQVLIRRLEYSGNGLDVDYGFLTTGEFTPDGNRFIASGGLANDIVVWDVATGAIDQVLSDHTFDVNELAVSPDGLRLASASTDNTVIIWDLNSGEKIARLLGHRQPVSAVAYSPDQKMLATADRGGMLQLWDANTFQKIDSTDQGDGNTILTLQFSPNSRLLAAGVKNDLFIWQLATGEKFKSPNNIHDGLIAQILFTRNGASIISGDRQGKLVSWNIANSNRVFSTAYGAHPSAIWAVAESPDGSLAATGDTEGNIILWDLRKSEPQARQLGTQSSEIHELEFSPDGEYLVSGDRSGQLAFWNLDFEGNPSMTIHQLGAFTDVEYSHDGKYLATTTTTGLLNSVGNQLLEPETSAGTLTLFDVTTPGDPQKVSTLALPYTTMGLAFSKDDRFLSFASEREGLVHVLDLEKKAIVSEADAWQSRYPTVVDKPEPFVGLVKTSGFLPESNDLLLTYNMASPEGIRSGIASWDWKDGSISYNDIPEFYPSDVVFDNDRQDIYVTGCSSIGTSLFDSCPTSLIRILNAATLQQLASLPIETQSVAMAMSSDDRILVIGDNEGNVSFLRIDSAYWIDLACQTAGRNLSEEEWQIHVGSQYDYRSTCPGFETDDSPVRELAAITAQPVLLGQPLQTGLRDITDSRAAEEPSLAENSSTSNLEGSQEEGGSPQDVGAKESSVTSGGYTTNLIGLPDGLELVLPAIIQCRASGDSDELKNEYLGAWIIRDTVAEQSFSSSEATVELLAPGNSAGNEYSGVLDLGFGEYGLLQSGRNIFKQVMLSPTNEKPTFEWRFSGFDRSPATEDEVGAEGLPRVTLEGFHQYGNPQYPQHRLSLRIQPADPYTISPIIAIATDKLGNTVDILVREGGDDVSGISKDTFLTYLSSQSTTGRCVGTVNNDDYVLHLLTIFVNKKTEKQYALYETMSLEPD